MSLYAWPYDLQSHSASRHAYYYIVTSTRVIGRRESMTSPARAKKALVRVRLCSTLAFVGGRGVCAIAKTTHFVYYNSLGLEALCILSLFEWSGIQVPIMKSKYWVTVSYWGFLHWKFSFWLNICCTHLWNRYNNIVDWNCYEIKYIVIKRL